jgi:hypothetical protein
MLLAPLSMSEVVTWEAEYSFLMMTDENPMLGALSKSTTGRRAFLSDCRWL